ncbi:hypothetical protein HY498_00290 [Candidatus Woesearchaeota archaeon]|nr:hypothetical protein [Candidatus Woesearchaeota archaeon]
MLREKEIDYLRDLLRKEPGNIVARRLLGINYFVGREYFNALRNFKVILLHDEEKLDNTSMTGWTHHDDRTILGLSFLELEVYDNASGILDHEVKDYCVNPPAWFGLGRCYYATGLINKDNNLLENAVKDFQEAKKHARDLIRMPNYKSICTPKKIFVENTLKFSDLFLAEVFKEEGQYFKAFKSLVSHLLLRFVLR